MHAHPLASAQIHHALSDFLNRWIFDKAQENHPDWQCNTMLSVTMPEHAHL